MDEFFKNKSVALVGNARGLLQKSFGKEIDSYDIVCRINRGFLLTEKYSEHYGSRTDIIFLNIYKTLSHHLKHKNFVIIQMTPSEEPVEKVAYCFPKQDLNDLKQLVQLPSTGLRCIHYLSKTDVKNIGIFGFDWKKTPTFYGTSSISTHGIHDFRLEEKVCREIYFKNEKFKVFE